MSLMTKLIEIRLNNNERKRHVLGGALPIGLHQCISGSVVSLSHQHYSPRQYWQRLQMAPWIPMVSSRYFRYYNFSGITQKLTIE